MPYTTRSKRSNIVTTTTRPSTASSSSSSSSPLRASKKPKISPSHTCIDDSKSLRKPRRGRRKKEHGSSLTSHFEGIAAPTPHSYNVGQRVYCQWNDESYYWGTITQVHKDSKKQQQQQHCVLYTVQFDDGDHCEHIPANNCFIESDPLMREAFIIDPSNDVVDNRRRRRHRMSLQVHYPCSNDYAIRKRNSSEQQQHNQQQHQQRDEHSANKRKCLSSKKVVGARCYARFSNGQMYWGRIFHVAPFRHKHNVKYAVQFDDGDQMTGLNQENVLTEVQYKLYTKEDPPTCSKEAVFCSSWNVWTLQRMFESRCRRCCLCMMEDCGKCSSCRDNQYSTTLWKRCCLFKLCKQIPALIKAQPIPSLRRLRFYIDEPNKWVDNFTKESWPKLAGLKVLVEIDGTEQVFDSLHAAIIARWPTRNPAPYCIEFYENCLGLDTRIPIHHELVGKGFCREWTDSTGRCRLVTGEIAGCFKQNNGLKEELQFQLQYNAPARDMGTLTYNVDGLVPPMEFVTEEDALGAYLAGLRHMGCKFFERSLPKNIGPLPCQWLVPAMRFLAQGSGTTLDVVLRVFGYQLRLMAKQSSVPHAGLGLWVECQAILREKDTPHYFQLEPGVLVDLGLYAPVRQNDKLDDEVATLKSFIHNWECGSWNFDAAESPEDIGKYSVFDITDDWTGELHDDAKRNTIVYANEISRGDLPSLVAKHDPLGCVHYLLGHTNRSRAPLRIPLGVEVELKVDYGPTYEKVRVRKGYPRATKSELKKIQQDIKNDDANFIDSIRDLNVKHLDDSLSFLENLFSFDQRAMEKGKVARAVLATSAMCLRLLEIQKEFEGVDIHSEEVTFCDGGYELLEKHNCVLRAQMLMARMCRRFKTNTELKEILVSNECHMDLVSRLLNDTKTAIIAMSADDFLGKLAHLTNE